VGVIDARGRARVLAATKREGKFTGELAPGSYLVVVSAPSYGTAEKKIRLNAGAKPLTIYMALDWQGP
jgi:hypothetical protein